MPTPFEQARAAASASRLVLAKPDVPALWESMRHLETATAHLRQWEARMRLAGPESVPDIPEPAEVAAFQADLALIGALLRQVGNQFTGWEQANYSREGRLDQPDMSRDLLMA